jgi:hypothetical protein
MNMTRDCTLGNCLLGEFGSRGARQGCQARDKGVTRETRVSGTELAV